MKNKTADIVNDNNRGYANADGAVSKREHYHISYYNNGFRPQDQDISEEYR